MSCRSRACLHRGNDQFMAELPKSWTLLHRRQTQVDVLAATSLMAVNGNAVLPRLEGFDRLFRQRSCFVLNRVSRKPGCQRTVDIDLGILIVVNQPVQLLDLDVAELDIAN